MYSLKNDLDYRIEEAKLILEMIKDYEKVRLSIKKLVILKSSLILLLYNTIESTMYCSLEELHSRLKMKTYRELNDKLKLIYANYYIKNIGQNKLCKEVLDNITQDKFFFPSLSNYEKKINLFNGNLDGKKINEILSLYGIKNIKNNDFKYLLLIKNKRNKLAHGEESFSESLRNFTYSELEKFVNSVNDILTEIITNFCDYIRSI